MKTKKVSAIVVSVIDVILIGLAPLIIVITGNLANFLKIPLAQFWRAFVSWYIPADIYSTYLLGICGLPYTILIAAFVIIGAYKTQKGSHAGKILLIITVLFSGITQALGVWANERYAIGPHTFNMSPIYARIAYALFLVVINLLLFLPAQDEPSLEGM
jgi:hypothetical protein